MRFGPIGEAFPRKKTKNITVAKRKFIVTPAMRTRDLAHHLFDENESFDRASGVLGSSHLIRTNPHIGR